jgi:hypothetical protein
MRYSVMGIRRTGCRPELERDVRLACPCPLWDALQTNFARRRSSGYDPNRSSAVAFPLTCYGKASAFLSLDRLYPAN